MSGATGGMSATGGMGAIGGMGATGGAGGSGSGGKATGGSGGAGGGAGGACPPTQLKSGDTTVMIMSGGVQRSALVHVPASATGGMTRVPLVMDFHGLTGNSNQQRQLSRWVTVGDAEGFITVFPQGLPSDRPGWNAGGCCNTVADDVQFVRDLIAYLHTVACIDPKRIHASGCSNGGAMSYMLACNAADLVASVAPVDFDCVVGGQCSQCNPGRPISVIQFRGTNDSAVPYSGAMPNFTRWGTINMCTGAATALTENSSCQTYPMCGAGAETILCSVQNGSHCGSYSSFMIPQLAWEILQRHPMP
jgi:polyhydroxybutyrate depolymerase